MKKAYVAPALEVEAFELETSIAANCTHVINAGPEYNGIDACSEWLELEDLGDVGFHAGGTTSFYDGTICDCKYSASGDGYFTS